jgi:hypothetical protein
MYQKVTSILIKNEDDELASVFSDIANKVDVKFEKTKRTLLVTKLNLY